MSKADDPARSTTHGVTPGFEDAPAPGPVGPDGQHASYWVLSEEERAKGFVRPVRTSYVHVGRPAPSHSLRDLTPEEARAYDGEGFVKYEEYERSESPDGAVGVALGRFWTQAELDRVGKGCGSTTTMGRAIAETYAREPLFYGATFCVACGTHLPVGERGEFVWSGTDERVGS